MPTLTRIASLFLSLLSGILIAGTAHAAEAGRGGVFSVVEISFQGPHQQTTDSPARDIEFWARFEHESGEPKVRVHGFWDGDGKGAMAGDLFKIRFCPTKAGRWTIVEVESNAPKLKGQRQGDHVIATPSDHPGFWLPDAESPGGAWYKRTDGSHPYIIGNTHYSFLSGYGPGEIPTKNDIAADVRGNAKYFKKLRFSVVADRYPNQEERPFLDDAGEPTNRGDFSHRPNPRWFLQRVDLAVATAWEEDLAADLILAGPDLVESRSTLSPGANKGDPAPYLRYIAARYGSYPNVWLCVCNEYEIKSPQFKEDLIARAGRTLLETLPHPLPLSVHSTPRTHWSPRFDDHPPWNDHIIIQRKVRNLAAAADVIESVRRNNRGTAPRLMPIVNDELSYEGLGDKHSEGDTIESHLGAFLGAGYGTTGEKPESKRGQYFIGCFDPSEHTSADNLKWLRETIDAQIAFWKMAPDREIFLNLKPDFRAMAWPGREYVLGTNASSKAMVAKLPPGRWSITLYDVVARKAETLAEEFSGRYRFDAPDSRAALIHFKRTSAGE